MPSSTKFAERAPDVGPVVGIIVPAVFVKYATPPVTRNSLTTPPVVLPDASEPFQPKAPTSPPGVTVILLIPVKSPSILAIILFAEIGVMSDDTTIALLMTEPVVVAPVNFLNSSPTSAVSDVFVGVHVANPADSNK